MTFFPMLVLSLVEPSSGCRSSSSLKPISSIPSGDSAFSSRPPPEGCCSDDVSSSTSEESSTLATPLTCSSSSSSFSSSFSFSSRSCMKVSPSDLNSSSSISSSSSSSRNGKKSAPKKRVRFARRSEFKYIEPIDWSTLIPPITADELFYTPSNYEKMRGECAWTLRLITMTQSSRSDEDDDDDDDDDKYQDDSSSFFDDELKNNLCLRGLEGQTFKATRKRWMGHAKQVGAVMIEQDRQKQQMHQRRYRHNQMLPLFHRHGLNRLFHHNHGKEGSRGTIQGNYHGDCNSSNDEDDDSSRAQRLADACREQSDIDVKTAYELAQQDAKDAQEIYYGSIHRHHDENENDVVPIREDGQQEQSNLRSNCEESKDPFELWCAKNEESIEKITRSTVFLTASSSDNKDVEEQIEKDNECKDEPNFDDDNTNATLPPSGRPERKEPDFYYKTGDNTITVLDTLPSPLKILHNMIQPKSCWDLFTIFSKRQ